MRRTTGPNQTIQCQAFNIPSAKLDDTMLGFQEDDGADDDDDDDDDDDNDDDNDNGYKKI